MNASGFVCATVLVLSAIAVQAVEPAAMAQAAPNPEAGATVILKGKLQNAGTNYFTDQRLVLTAEGQDPIVVQGFAPAEISGDRSARRGGPPVLSNYLDKDVVLTGHMETKLVKGVGLTKVFVVTGAQTAD